MKHQPEEQFEELIIELKDKMVVLKVLPFDTDNILVDEMLKIDYNAIIPEILTFSVIFNRIANLKAEQEEIVSLSKFNLEVLFAQLSEEKRKSLTSYEDADAKGKTKINKPTKDEVENAVIMDAGYGAKKRLHFQTVKNLEFLTSLYWASQNKAGLLKVISDKIRPEEFMGELLTDTINGVMIKASKKAIL